MNPYGGMVADRAGTHLLQKKLNLFLREKRIQ